jgi:hypothetical protein
VIQGVSLICLQCSSLGKKLHMMNGERKMWSINTIDYYSVINNEIMLFAGKGMKLDYHIK